MKNRHALSVFSLTMMTVGSVDSIRNLPATALFGSQLIAFFILGAIFFLIPAALVSAELSSRSSMKGGIYIWVKEAFGPNIGFLAIWLQWIENVIWYPTILSFVAGTIGYLLHPSLAENPYFLFAIIVCCFWGVTWINIRGMHFSAKFSTICTICGLLLPMSLIIILGALWVVNANPIHITFHLEHIWPKWDDPNILISLTAIMLSFCGIEIATVHANDVADPQAAFPRSLFFSVCIILSTLVLGSLAIAIVLPQNEINLVAGIMQAFNAFFAKYNLLIFMPLIAFSLVLGGLGSVNNWIIAPTKGLWFAAEDGHLFAHFRKLNKHDAPIALLVFQAIIVTLLSMLFLFMPSVNGSYWLLTALAAQLYMFMYLLMFFSAIKLKFSKKQHSHEGFHISGGKLGALIISILGIVGVLVTIAVSFIPPSNMNIGSVLRYETLLISGLLLMCAPPIIILLKKLR